MPGPGRYQQIKKQLGPGKGPWRGAMAPKNPKGFPKSGIVGGLIGRNERRPAGGVKPPKGLLGAMKDAMRQPRPRPSKPPKRRPY